MADSRTIPGESREETVRRVADEQGDLLAAEGSTPDRDVSTRRHLGTRAVVSAMGAAVLGALIGLLFGVVFWNPGIPVALAIVFFAVGLLLSAERDDGVVASKVGGHVRRSGRAG